MTAIAITPTSCHSCGRRVEDAMHLMLCDGCLDARLAQPKPMPVRALAATVFAALAALRQPPVQHGNPDSRDSSNSGIAALVIP